MHGKARHGRQGMAGLGGARHGRARQAGQRGAWIGMDGMGLEWQAGHGKTGGGLTAMVTLLMFSVGG